jgi:hypothetical protein
MTVGFEGCLQVEDFREVLLDPANTFADADLPAELGFQKLRSRQMICMRVCFENPFERKAVAPYVVDDLRGTGRIGPAGYGAKTEYRIDYDGSPGFGIAESI